MMSQVTLLLICMLFSKALSLTCQECLPSASGTCNNKQTTCSVQCITSTTSVYTSGTKLIDYNIKTCGVPELCVNGSLNLGEVKVTSNAKCCSTDLCNTETLPALPRQAPNGRMCYTCDADGCSGTVNCERNEDRCISVSVDQGGNTVSMKGCVSNSLCVVSGSSSAPGIGISNLHCCEGNLCNSAESFTLRFLLMIVPLLFSILFY